MTAESIHLKNLDEVPGMCSPFIVNNMNNTIPINEDLPIKKVSPSVSEDSNEDCLKKDVNFPVQKRQTPSRLQVFETISCMQNREKHYVAQDYLSTMKRMNGELFSNVSFEKKVPTEEFISEEWRKQVCEWMYKVVDFYVLDRKIIAVAMNYLDRYITVSQCYDTKNCQLATMASFYIAVKLYEPRNKLSRMILRDFTVLCRGLFTENQIVEKENSILFSISWLMNPPTPQEFAHYFLQLLPSNMSQNTRVKVLEVSNYIIELVMFMYDFVSIKPSIIALASITLAMESLDSQRKEHGAVSPARLDCLLTFTHLLTESGFVKGDELEIVCNNLRKELKNSRREIEELQASIDSKEIPSTNLSDTSDSGLHKVQSSSSLKRKRCVSEMTLNDQT